MPAFLPGAHPEACTMGCPVQTGCQIVTMHMMPKTQSLGCCQFDNEKCVGNSHLCAWKLFNAVSLTTTHECICRSLRLCCLQVDVRSRFPVIQQSLTSAVFSRTVCTTCLLCWHERTWSAKVQCALCTACSRGQLQVCCIGAWS